MTTCILTQMRKFTHTSMCIIHYTYSDRKPVHVLFQVMFFRERAQMTALQLRSIDVRNLVRTQRSTSSPRTVAVCSHLTQLCRVTIVASIRCLVDVRRITVTEMFLIR